MHIIRGLSIGVLSAGLLALIPASSSAQDGRRLHVSVGGGPTFNGGTIGDVFKTGWGPAIGVTFDVSERVGIQFEYAYRWFDASDELPLEATRFSAHHNTHQLAFNLVANLTRPDAALRGYVVGGPGAYNRSVEITEYVGSGTICNPAYYICGTHPIDAIVGSRGGWDFGFSIGAGVGFKIGEASEFFLESRYHFVAGPEVASPLASDLDATNTDGHYWPLTFGFRF